VRRQATRHRPIVRRSSPQVKGVQGHGDEGR
jgi:hypothetical protein